MAELEISISDRASERIAQIRKEINDLRNSADKGIDLKIVSDQLKEKKKEIASLKDIAGPEIKQPKSLAKTEKEANSLAKGYNLVGGSVGRLAGTIGPFGDLLEETGGKLLEAGGSAKYLGISLLGVGVAALSVYGLGKAAFFAGEQFSKSANSIIKTKLELGSLSGEYKEVRKAGYDMAYAVGGDVGKMTSSIASFRKAGANLSDASSLAVFQETMEEAGRSDAVQILEKIKKAGKGDTAGKILGTSPEDVKAFNKAFEGLGIKFSSTATQAQMLQAILSSGDVNKLKEDAIAAADPMEKLKVSFAKFAENAMASGEAKKAVENISKVLENPKLIENVSELTKSLSEGFTVITEALPAVTSVFGFISYSIKSSLTPAFMFYNLLRDSFDILSGKETNPDKMFSRSSDLMKRRLEDNKKMLEEYGILEQQKPNVDIEEKKKAAREVLGQQEKIPTATSNASKIGTKVNASVSAPISNVNNIHVTVASASDVEGAVGSSLDAAQRSNTKAEEDRQKRLNKDFGNMFTPRSVDGASY